MNKLESFLHLKKKIKADLALDISIVGGKRREHREKAGGHKDRPHHVTGQIQPQDFKMVGPCNLGPTGSPRGSNMWKWWPLCCASGQLAVPVNVSLRSGRAGRQHCVRLSRGLKTTRDVKDESVN